MTAALARKVALASAAVVLAVVAFAAVAAVRPPSALAHPLGNFTVNRYSRIELYSDAIRVRYVLDMAEIPAYQEMGRVDTNGDGHADDAEAATYARARATGLAANLSLSVDNQRAELNVLSQQVTFPAGQAGLDTLRLVMTLEARTANTREAQLDYADHNYSDRIGWKEIVVRPAAGVRLDGAPPTEDISRELTDYPGDLLTSPLDITQLALSFDAANGAVAPAVTAEQPPAITTAPERSGAGFASLINTDDLSLAVVLLALLAAFGFGALHALEPGHGKTFVAAYFVGVKGTARQAVTLGGIIAVTHTVGVLGIGAITLVGSQWILPERLYPWLGLASALMVLALGVRLLVTSGILGWLTRAVLRRGARSADHSHSHAHGHSQPQPAEGGPAPWRTLVALGLADGLTPSPSALVVIIAAVSLHRIGLGLALVVAFSVGLAGVLTAVCLGLVFARRIGTWLHARVAPLTSVPRLRTLAGRLNGEAILARNVPLAAGFVVIGVGLFLTARALSNPMFGL